MYWRPSIDTSAACRFSRTSTSGLPAAIRVKVRASSSKIWIRSSALRSITARGDAGVSARRGAELRDLGQEREEGEQVRREVGEVGTLGRRAAGVAGAEVVLDELAEALVRERLVLLDEPPVEDADLPHRNELLQLFQEPRLPDSRLAGHDRELAVAGDRGVQASLELGELLLASRRKPTAEGL